ncbi:MAG: hypothetical protein JWO53_519 [Chlamydiia bacterium]|nr:hypothetical protein [Chlamydiia bacterium]
MNHKQKVQELDQKYNFMVTGRHVDVTDAMKTYAIEKIAKLERFATRIIDVLVTMDIQRYQHKVEIVMKYGNTTIKSGGVTTDMYASIDIAVHKLESQLKRYLTRIHEHHTKDHPIKDVPETVYEAFFEDEVDLLNINDEIENETKKQQTAATELPKIVGTEVQPLKILTNEEAIMKMDLSKAVCLVFRGEKDRKLKVIYRRRDGNYGIVEPE